MHKVPIICLNPHCSYPNSRMHFRSKETIIEHEKCKNWLVNLDIKNIQQIEELDFFKHPIASALSIDMNEEFFATFKKAYDEFSNRVMSKLAETYHNIYKKFQIFYENVTYLKNIIEKSKKEFRSENLLNEINNNVERFHWLSKQGKILLFNENQIKFSNINKIDLMNIEEIEKSTGFSSENMTSENSSEMKHTNNKYLPELLKTLLEEIYPIVENCFSEIEHKFYKPEEASMLELRECEMIKFFKTYSYFSNTKEPPSKKLQAFQSCIPQLNLTISEDHSIGCIFCSEKIFGGGNTVKEKRFCVQESFLNHLTTQHEKEIIKSCGEKMFRLNAIKITFQQFIIGIKEWKNRKYLLVDRENIKQDYNDKEMYCLEIVSKRSESIARGRYIVADSKERNAADVLTILCLYEIVKAGGKEIILLTNDHFGTTVQCIFYHFGVNIELQKK